MTDIFCALASVSRNVFSFFLTGLTALRACRAAFLARLTAALARREPALAEASVLAVSLISRTSAARSMVLEPAADCGLIFFIR